MTDDANSLKDEIKKLENEISELIDKQGLEDYDDSKVFDEAMKLEGDNALQFMVTVKKEIINHIKNGAYKNKEKTYFEHNRKKYVIEYSDTYGIVVSPVV